jgi:hypothetical protein
VGVTGKEARTVERELMWDRKEALERGVEGAMQGGRKVWVKVGERRGEKAWGVRGVKAERYAWAVRRRGEGGWVDMLRVV